jgi:hypothetical protein
MPTVNALVQVGQGLGFVVDVIEFKNLSADYTAELKIKRYEP